MKKNILLLLLIISSHFIFAQYQERDTNLMYKGFEFYIGGGLYIADKKTADFYSGKPENMLNLNLLFNNHYRYEEVTRYVKEKRPYVDSIWLSSYGESPNYKIAMCVSLGLRYKFDKHWGFGLMYTYVRLTGQNVFFIDYPRVLGNDRQELQGMIAAKEERSAFDFSASYMFHPNAVVKPFIEMGFQFNYVKLKGFDVNIEDHVFNLMNEVTQPYIPGQQVMPNYRNWGAPGYGFSLVAGIKLAFSKNISLDPMLYASVCSMGHSTNLEDYNTGFGFNYAVIVRLLINDHIFSNRNN